MNHAEIILITHKYWVNIVHSRTYFSLKNVKHHHFSSFNCQSARPNDFCSGEKRVRSRCFDPKCGPKDTILFYSWMLSFASVLWPIKFIIGKLYSESAARILLRTCAVMLRTRTVIMADKFCPYFGDYFCCFLFWKRHLLFFIWKGCIKWLILDKTRSAS